MQGDAERYGLYPTPRSPAKPKPIVSRCSDEAQSIAEALDGQGMSGLVADHVLRKHVFPLFVLTALFIALYVAYKIVGDPLLQIMKASAGGEGLYSVSCMP